MNNEINNWLDYSVYTIYNSNKFDTYDICFKEMDNLYHMIKNYIKRFNYDSASFIIGISNTKSNTAKITYKKSGKKGRPKKQVLGIPVSWHIHLYVACSNSSVSVFANNLRLYLQKKKNIDFYQKKNILCNALPYIEKQCIYIRRFGEVFKKTNPKKI